MPWWIMSLWLAPVVLVLFPLISVLLNGRPCPKADASTGSLHTPLRENCISRYVLGLQKPGLPASNVPRAVTRQRSIRPIMTSPGCLHLGSPMPGGDCPDLQSELIELVRALRRRAARMRQQAPHDNAPERSRAFADYLDARADILQTHQRGALVVQTQRPRRQDQPAACKLGIAAWSSSSP